MEEAREETRLEEFIYAVPDEDPPVEFRRGTDGKFYKREAKDGVFAEDGSDWEQLRPNEIRRYLSGNGSLAVWLRELVLPEELEEDPSDIEVRRILDQKI